MRRLFRFSACIALFASLALMAPTPTHGQSSFPFVGEVTVNQVNVRAAAGDNYYTVGTLRQGDRVLVQERFIAWYKVTPPAGVHSFIRKEAVERRGDIGEVISTREAARAANLDGPGESYRAQVFLFEGDRVRIVGEDGGYYRIMPPAGAFVYVPVTAIRTTRDDPRRFDVATANARSAAPSPASTRDVIQEDDVEPVDDQPTTPAEPDVPSTEPTTDPGSAAEAVPAPAPAVDPAEDQPASIVQAEALKRAEARLAEAMQLPLEEQPLEELRTAYRAIQADASLVAVDRHVVRLRLAQIERNLVLRDALARVHAGQVAMEQADQPSADDAPAVRPRQADYLAVGRLVASGVYDGNRRPRLYRLISRQNRTIAYVRPGAAIDPKRTLGQIVGLEGAASFDPGVNLQVIEATRVDILAAEADAAPQSESQPEPDESAEQAESNDDSAS